MSKKALQAFLKAHFDFTSLKKSGFFPKEMKHTDYEGQAKRICDYFGLASIYEYGKYEIRAHITYANGVRKPVVDKDGNVKVDPPFVETFFPNSMHITKQ